MEMVENINKFSPVVMFYTGWTNVDFAKLKQQNIPNGEFHIFQGSKEAIELTERTSPDALFLDLDVFPKKGYDDGRPGIEEKIGLDLSKTFGEEADPQLVGYAIKMLQTLGKRTDEAKKKPIVFMVAPKNRDGEFNKEDVLIARTVAYHTGYDIHLIAEKDTYYLGLVESFGPFVEQSTLVEPPQKLPRATITQEAIPEAAAA